MIASLASLAGLLVGAWGLPDEEGGGAPTENLLGCDIEVDLRPLRLSGASHPISQVYHANFSDEEQQRFGTEFQVHVPRDGVMAILDGAGASVVTTAGRADVNPLRKASVYKVQLYWDADGEGSQGAGAYMRVLKDGAAVDVPKPVANATGSFDRRGKYHEPVIEVIHPTPTSPEKKRLKVGVKNKGLQLAFMVGDL